MIITLQKIMFSDWLLEKIKERGWTQADLARASGLTTAAISKYMSGRIPEKDALKRIAHAFDVPIEELYRVTGMLPPNTESDLLTKTIMHLMRDLDNDEKTEILEYVKLRKRISRRDKDNG